MTEPSNGPRIRPGAPETSTPRRRPDWAPPLQYFSFSSVLLARAEFKERHGRYPTASELRLLGLDVEGDGDA